MPANFPSTVPLRFPLQRGVKVASRVVEFLDGTEQRWREGPVLNSLSLTMNEVPRAQVDDVENWFATIKGAFDSSWSITVGSETFTNMGLESDDLVITESGVERFSLALQMRQTAPSGSWPSPAAVFPGINGGRLVQRPWTGKDRFLTTRNDLPGGARYAFYERGTALRAWEIPYSCLTVAELVTLMQFFVAMGGRWGAFSLTDPQTGTVYTHCRFDTEVFQATYVDAGHCSVSLPIVEFAV